MNIHDDTESPRGSLRDKLPPIEPPAALAERVQRSLIDRGLIVAPRRSVHWIRRGSFVAVAASFLVVGFLAGRSFSPEPGPPKGIRYALMLYDGESTPSSRSGARSQEYGKWLHDISSGDHESFGGEELGPVITTLGRRGVSEAPVGFFIISAKSEKEAASIAQSSPHVKYGGSIVLQRIVD
jgi:hypothetical protein